jgi:hypothetical protein
MNVEELNLVTVEFETTLGAVYVFPDMDLREVESLIRRFTFENNVTLLNISRACLVIPPRIVRSIRIEGVEKWSRPASLA